MSCVQGEAKDTLTGFKIEESQYESAIEQLKERFDDEELVIHSHYEALTKLSKCASVTANLRSTLNTIETHLRSLVSLGENVEGKHIVTLIKSKFPTFFYHH